jgi:hypothetical protein
VSIGVHFYAVSKFCGDRCMYSNINGANANLRNEKDLRNYLHPIQQIHQKFSESFFIKCSSFCYKIIAKCCEISRSIDHFRQLTTFKMDE